MRKSPESSAGLVPGSVNSVAVLPMASGVTLPKAVTDERMGMMSASSVERYMACPGSRALELSVAKQAIPKPDTSDPSAAHGTMLHEANESGDVSDLKMSDAEQVSEIRKKEEMFARQWCADLNLDFSKIKIIREERYFFYNICSAQLDTLCIIGKHALYIDAKSGRKMVVPPIRNWQLRTCVAAAHEKHKFKTCRTAIANVWGHPQAPCDYSSADIAAIKKRLWNLSVDVHVLKHQRNPGDHCDHCPAKKDCPEIREQMSVVLQQRTLLWDAVPAEKKAAIWKMAVLVEKTAKDLKAQIKSDLAADPASCPGLKKLPDGETRSISNTIAAYNALKDVKQIDLLEFVSKCKISLEAIGEILGSKKEAEMFLASGDDKFVKKSPRSGSVEVEK